MDDNLKYTWYADIINIAVTVEGKSGLLTLLLFNRHGKVLEGFELIGKTVEGKILHGDKGRLEYLTSVFNENGIDAIKEAMAKEYEKFFTPAL